MSVLFDCLFIFYIFLLICQISHPARLHFISIGNRMVFLVQFGINCTSEFFKKLKLDEVLLQVQFQLF